jgi:hypothetical protein
MVTIRATVTDDKPRVTAWAVINGATRVSLRGKGSSFSANWTAPANNGSAAQTYAITLYAQDKARQQVGPVTAGTVMVRGKAAQSFPPISTTLLDAVKRGLATVRVRDTNSLLGRRAVPGGGRSGSTDRVFSPMLTVTSRYGGNLSLTMPQGTRLVSRNPNATDMVVVKNYQVNLSPDPNEYAKATGTLIPGTDSWISDQRLDAAGLSFTKAMSQLLTHNESGFEYDVDLPLNEPDIMNVLRSNFDAQPVILGVGQQHSGAAPSQNPNANGDVMSAQLAVWALTEDPPFSIVAQKLGLPEPSILYRAIEAGNMMRKAGFDPIHYALFALPDFDFGGTAISGMTVVGQETVFLSIYDPQGYEVFFSGPYGYSISITKITWVPVRYPKSQAPEDWSAAVTALFKSDGSLDKLVFTLSGTPISLWNPYAEVVGYAFADTMFRFFSQFESDAYPFDSATRAWMNRFRDVVEQLG